MATSSEAESDLTPHKKTKILRKYTAVDYGPLQVLQYNPVSTFRGGSYRITTPIDSELIIYRLYGGEAGEGGRFWSAEKRDGNLSYAMDVAILPQWNNTLENQVSLTVPRGIFLFEGYVEAQHPDAKYGRYDGGYLGGGWQVFIPKAILDPLLQAERASAEGKAEDVKQHVEEAFSAQNAFMESYDKKVIELGLQQEYPPLKI